MQFLQPAARPWRVEALDYACIDGATIGPDVMHVLRATALVESRADQYSDYLRAVFAHRNADWNVAIDAWNRDERQHGVALRRLCESVDTEFNFTQCMKTYLATVDYHACDGVSVRGSVAGELVARCVVEALASTLYRVLSDAVRDPMSASILAYVAKDEARHYGMFRALLAAEESLTGPLGRWRRLRVGIGRMLEWSDDQIMRAAWVASDAFPAPYARRQIAHVYAASLYGHYRYEHLHYTARLLGRTLLGSTSPLLCDGLALGLWIGVKARWLLARLARRRPGRHCVPALATG
ncbi:MAG: ferritin-like domain-containing protein [Tahibacter sp.]